MDNSNGHIINLANSIIGVSILAMPYCFRQCGILLSIFLLLISSVISRLACHFLLKSAILARRKTFEFLAFHIFGSLGKFSIEIGMIGFLLGTCIAFFVVMGDLGPAILSEITGVQTGNALRNSILVALAVFCVLPLGLLRNVDSLNGVSTATIGFYICLVLNIIIDALPHIFTGDWVSEVIIWRPAGILQCLPIFSMALFCQTQLFEIYQAIPNASLDKMNEMIRVAVNMCTWVYIFVGAFGYIAFFQKPFTGNILLTFMPSVTSDVIKFGFVLSLAFSFPLVIFPCRASLYSLLYKGTSYSNLHEMGAPNHIPEGKFKMLTFVIVFVSLLIGIMIPSIELVLGLIGSTIGVMICVVFPVTCFICISPKNTNERILAQIMLFVGVVVMVLGTYANLQAVEEANLNIAITEKIPPLSDISAPKINLIEQKKPVVDIPTTMRIGIVGEKKKKPPDAAIKVDIAPPTKESAKEVRHEPPQPVEPVENQPVKEGANEVRHEPPEPVDPVENQPVLKNVEEKIEDKQKPVVEPIQPHEDNQNEEKKTENKEPAKVDMKINEDIVDIEAIKKEDKELKEQEEKQKEDKNQLLIDTIQKQNEVQKEIVEQQKKLIEVIQQQQESVKKQEADKVNEEKVKAVKHIEDIARRAIESISGQENKKPKEENNENKEKIPVKEDKKTDVNVPEASKESVKTDIEAKTENVQNVKLKISQNNTNKSNQMKMLPLPMALAKVKNVTSGNNNKSAENGTAPDVNEGNAMRRDILSNDILLKIRNKREINEETVNNLNKAVKEVCEEINKSTSTEKPIIKMLCKLSEPNLMKTANLKFMEAESVASLKQVSEH